MTGGRDGGLLMGPGGTCREPERRRKQGRTRRKSFWKTGVPWQRHRAEEKRPHIWDHELLRNVGDAEFPGGSREGGEAAGATAQPGQAGAEQLEGPPGVCGQGTMVRSLYERGHVEGAGPGSGLRSWSRREAQH